MLRKTISLDLRERIVAAYDNDEGTQQEIARRFKVSWDFVKKLFKQRRRTGDIAARHRFSGRKPIILGSHQRELRAMLARKPDLTLEEMRDALGLSCTIQAIHYVLEAMGLTYKKRHSAPANKIARTSPRLGGRGAGSSPASIRRA
jgi:transposase